VPTPGGTWSANPPDAYVWAGTQRYVEITTTDPTPPPDIPKFVNPPGQTISTSSNATFTNSGLFVDLQEVFLNNNKLTIDDTDKTKLLLSGYPGYNGVIGHAESGSTRIILYQAFLSTLPAGTHTLMVRHTPGGMAAVDTSTTFLIGSTTAISPKTGDDLGATLWYTLLLVSVLGISGVLIYNRPKNIKLYGNKRR